MLASSSGSDQTRGNAIVQHEPNTRAQIAATITQISGVLRQKLASNLIPPLEDSGLLIDEFEYFLAVRLELIVSKINELAGTLNLKIK